MLKVSKVYCTKNANKPQHKAALLLGRTNARLCAGRYVSARRASVAVLAFTSIQACSYGIDECSGTSPSVLWAQSLSPERLELMYSQIEARAERGEEYIRARKGSPQSPPELQDLNYHSLFLRGTRRAQLNLQGCFDEYVIIYFVGIYDDKTPAIRLQWAESGSEILWRK